MSEVPLYDIKPRVQRRSLVRGNAAQQTVTDYSSGYAGPDFVVFFFVITTGP